MHYRVGAVDDPAGRSGMAHLVEHLMFEQDVDGQSIAQRLSAAATYHNATTTLDATTYVARAHRSRLRELLSIEAMRLRTRCSGLSQAEFERERDVVLNEIRYRERTSDVLAALRGALYGDAHPYARRVEGTVETVSAIARDEACAFVDAHYAAGNAVLVVSGDQTRAQVEPELAELGKIQTTAFATAAAVAAPSLVKSQAEISVPFDETALALVWQLPDDVKGRIQRRALLRAATELMSNEIDGDASMFDPGDARGSMIAVVLVAGDEETDLNLVNGADRALRRLPKLFERGGIRELDQLGFNRMKLGALYDLYAQLDDPSERDPMLASLVAEGLEPEKALRDYVSALRELTATDAIAVSKEHLKYEDAKAIAFKPTKKAAVQRLALATRSDAVENHRAPSDAAEAHRPAPVIGVDVPAFRRRTLANGLDVILVPTGATPIVDVRLVFRTGSGDEPPSKRGVTTVAARALDFDSRHVKDVLGYIAAGGSRSVDVDFDRTTFAVRGMSGQLDYLLAALRRLARDGVYEEGVVLVNDAIKRAHQRSDEAVDAWRSALYGAQHPYATAGLLRHASESLTSEDAAQFRAAHFTPDNATLIVAGQFDQAIVDRWIDYLFGDWRGDAASRDAPEASFEPAAFALSDQETATVKLSLAFRATASDAPARLVVAEMLAEVMDSVRTQRGASYAITDGLDEKRLAATYVATLQVDATQAVAVAKLLAERLSKLQTDTAYAAQTFVAARRRVLARVASAADSASRFADRIEHDVALGRAPASAEDVRKLTVEMMPVADLALSRAVVVMRGPAEIEQAFVALGREAKTIEVSHDTKPEGEVEQLAGKPRQVANVTASSLEVVDPLTKPSSPYHVAFSMFAGASFATITKTLRSPTDVSYRGPSLAAAFGYRRRSTLRAGLRLDVSRLAGTTPGADPQDVSFVALGLGPFVQARLHGPFWFGVTTALRVEHDVRAQLGVQAGAELGILLVPAKYGWLTVLAHCDYVRMPETSYGAVTIAAGLRR